MNTLFLGQHLINLDKVDSTNNYTSMVLRHNVMPEGAVITTNHQTLGKGQRGNVWKSNAGENLTFSVYIKPKFIPIADQFLLNKWVSVSLCAALKEKGVIAEIKWPNDIYVKGKKIAGILIENSVSKTINHSIVGIGLNVNQLHFENVPNATSLYAETGKKTELDSLLAHICFKLEQNYLSIKVNKKVLDKTYIEKMYLYKKRANYTDKTGAFIGKIIGISSLGLLQIERGNEVNEYSLKEVKFLGKLP